MTPRLFISLVAFSLVISQTTSLCEDSQLEVGFFYSCQVTVDSFFATPGVRVSAKQKGYAGIPEWLTVNQANSSSNAYIYGTPTEEGTLTLEITVLNENTLESMSREIQLTISPLEGTVLQTHELYITNFELLDFLRAEVQSAFNSTLSAVYQQLSGATPSLLSVIHPSSRGIPVPLPPAKHGVIVQVTPGLDVSAATLSTSMETSCERSFSQVFMENGFEVHNCTFMAYTIGTGLPASTTQLPDDDRQPPFGTGSSISLVVILVLGVVFMVMILTGLAWVFFGGRKKGFYVSHKKRVQKSTMRGVSKTTSRGPVTAQTHLRDLAQPPSKKKSDVPSPAAVEEGLGRPQSTMSDEALLEFQDMTDYSNPDTTDSSASTQPPPPAYSYPKVFFTQPQAPPQQH